MNQTNICEIEEQLGSGNWETARRLCLRELAKGPNAQVSILLHKAYHHLADIPSLRGTIDGVVPSNEEERFQLLLAEVQDAERLGTNQYRYFFESPECKAGLSHIEFCEKWMRRAAELWKEISALSNSESRRQAVAAVRAELKPQPGAERHRAEIVPSERKFPSFGSLSGTLKFADGNPVADADVTLGLEMEVERFDVRTFNSIYCGIQMKIEAEQSLNARTDGHGQFRFEKVPAGLHEFLAVRLDPEKFDIATRFVAQGITISEGKETSLDLVVEEWASAPDHEVVSPFTPQLVRSSVTYRLVHEEKFHNPFHYSFPRQEVRFALPPGVPADPAKLLLLSSADPDAPLPVQLIGSDLVFFADLPEVSDRVVALFVAESAVPQPAAAAKDLRAVPEADGTAVINTGRASFRIPFGEGRDGLPPIISVRGEDGLWRGHGRFKLPPGIEIVSRKTEFTIGGPLVIEWTTRYQLSNGASYELRFTAHRDEPYLLVHEISPDVEGMAFEFSLREFMGGRSYLHWSAEGSTMHWTSLEPADREVARLQESVMWWGYPSGFGYGVGFDGFESRDLIAVFSVRRGEWIDRKFERIAQGPIGPDGKSNRELDWPEPEMIGSTISMITANTTSDGDVFFNFGLFDGERRWGILVSTWERTDGPHKEISSVQHKVSSPRLQHVKDWHFDRQDTVSRPCVVAHRHKLRAIRRKKNLPGFRDLWHRIQTRKSWESAESLAFAVDGDPVLAWRKKKELLTTAPLRARAVLRGRDVSDLYSPVAGRLVTAFIEDYDLIAASGVFTPEEERVMRNYFILMGHMFMETDFMNWRYNSRNANFESDRVEIVGTVGLAFRGHPDSEKFIGHGVSLMEKSLEVYCTPGSGKWFENPAGYYLQALRCKTTLLFHLAQEGVFDPTRMARLKDFLRWGILLLTPPAPRDYAVMRDGCAADQFPATEKIRRIPPIGDHARIGAETPGHYALMAKLFRPHDPAFANLLLWAYQAGGSDGASPDNDGFYTGNTALVFASLDEEDLVPPPAQELSSRRLEAFGAVFRGAVNTEREFYLLFKQGPCGYRYHNTEGSIIMFANGKPLIYEGGGAGETWRHTTLSFYDVHRPLSIGHVERFHAFPGVDFCQGVHPVLIKPGDPEQLCNSAGHDLVPVAWERFAEPNPLDVRSLLWVKDEYVILHDDLRLDPAIPSHWHAQVMAVGETGNARDGYIFKGRFGTDLQVVLPGQTFSGESCTAVPLYEYDRPKDQCVTLRHLQLTGDKPDHYLAVMRPLAAGKKPIRAQEMRRDGSTYGVRVEGEGIDDLIFSNRQELSLSEAGAKFQGRYGAVLKRGAELQLVLLAGSLIEAGGVRLQSSGPSVFVAVRAASMEVAAEGDGVVEITRNGKTNSFTVAGRLGATLAI